MCLVEEKKIFGRRGVRGVEKENPNKKSKQMRVQEAFPVDYFVFSCIAPNFPAEKKWMWCWFQTI